MVAALARLFGLEQADARIRHLEPAQLKRQIFMATRTLVERRLAAGPLVLLAEGLHWADAAPIELIGAGAGRPPPPPPPVPPGCRRPPRAPRPRPGPPP